MPDDEPDHVPAPAEHSPRKYAAYDPDSGTFTVAEEENMEAWVRAENDAALTEVRE